jgi:oligosaccharide repeat unit polymerase
MTLISFLSFLICLAIVLSTLRKGADVWSPGRVFGFIWALAVGLADLKFSGLQSEWSVEGWLLILIGIFSFLLGVLSVNVLNLSSPLTSIRTMRAMLGREAIRHKRFFWLIVSLFLAYAISYGLNVLLRGEVPAFSETPGSTRVGFGLFGIGLVIHVAPIVMFFVNQYFVLVPGHRFRKTILGTVFLMSLGSFFLLLYRFDLVIWIIATVVFLYYASRHIRPRTILILGVLIASLYVGIQSIRFIGHIENYLYYVSKMRFGLENAAFTEPYMYVAMNLENFVRAAERLDHHTFGYYTFNALMSLTGLKHWIAEYAFLSETPYLNSGYNTYSFLWVYYRDFGVVGLALFPFLLGLVIAYLYYELRKNPRLITVSLYGMAVFVMAISFFHNALSLLHFVFNVGVVYAVHRLIFIKEPGSTSGQSFRSAIGSGPG